MYLAQGRIYKYTKENLARVPNSAGNYRIYNKKRKHVYTGTTKGNTGAKWGNKPHQRYRYGLRHRLGANIQKDDHKEHPTKKGLQREAKYFSYKVFRNDNSRRAAEKRDKQGLKHNHL